MTDTQPQPQPELFSCLVTLPRWKLHVTHLTRNEGRDLGQVMELANRGAMAELRRSFPGGRIEEGKTLLTIRRSLERMGHDAAGPCPVAELLIASFLETGGVVRGSLAWDFLALLTVRTQAPWSVLDSERLAPPLTFRQGEPGEFIEHAGGQLDCAGLPVLADCSGVQATPWTHGWPNDLEDCRSPLFICYLPRELFRAVQPRSHMGQVVWRTWAYKFVFERTCSYRD